MESNGAFNAEMNTSEEPHSRSRSRSPLNKSPKERRMSSSRDSSVTRERERQPKGNRSRTGTGGRNRAPSNRRVYVANIGYDSKWTEIKDLFREKVGDVSYVELFEDENGKFRGCGIVEFKEPGSVQKAIDILHRFEFKGRQLVIKEDFDVERDKTGRPVTRSTRGRDRDGGRSSFGLALSNPQYNTYGLSPQFLESLGITGPLSKRIFVANLDYKVSTKKLQDIFKMAGKVINIELKTDKDGNSKGHGTIEFEHPVEAVQAISMLNGQKLFNRTMSVRMDKFKEELDGVPSKLPDGLQGLGKGLGAGGQPLQLNKSVGGGHGMLGVGTGAGLATGNLSSNMGMGMGMGMTSNNMNLMANNQLGMNALGGVGGTGGLGMGLGMGNNLTNERSMLGGGIGGGLTGNVGGMGLAGAGGLTLGNTGNAGMGMGMAGNNSLMGSGLSSAMSSNTGGMGGNMGGGGMGGSMGLGLGGSGSGGGGGGSGNYGDYDQSYEREDSYRAPRSSDTIIVRNLPVSFTWQTLRDRFRDIGEVRFTEMKNRGTAVVRFSSEREAQRAVDLMHGCRIDGRAVDVHLY